MEESVGAAATPVSGNQAGDVAGHWDPRWHVGRFAGPLDQPRYIRFLQAVNHPRRHWVVWCKTERLATLGV